MKYFFTYYCLLLVALGLPPGRLRAQALDPAFQPTILKTAYVGGLQTGAQVLAVQPDGKTLVAGGFDYAGGALASKLMRLNADGTLDAAFNPGGTGANGFIAALAVQPDGKIIIVGGFTVYNGTPQLAQARLNANGTLDASFAGLPVAGLRQLAAVALQPDGKVLVGGTTGFGTALLPAVVRLNADGTPDASFNPPASTAGDFVRIILAQADGKIVLGGSGTTAASALAGGVQRLNANGSIDAGFSSGLSTNLAGVVYALLQQPDGKLLAGGTVVPAGATASPGVVRLLPGGALDNTFVTGSGPLTAAGVNTPVRALGLLPSGSVLVGGSFTQYNGVARGRVARLLPTGAVDTGFATGAGANNAVIAIDFTATGQVLLAGSLTQYDGGAARTGVVRLSATGTEDVTFTPPLLEGRGTVNRAGLLANGQLLVQGNIASVNGAAQTGGNSLVRRFNANGALDASFVTTATVLLGAQPDGNFYTLNLPSTTGSQYSLVRVLPSGALDNTFANPVYTYVYGTATQLFPLQGVVAQPDGKLLAYGLFSTFGGVSRNGIARLNANGTVDNTFVPPAGTQRQTTSVVLQASGKLLVTYLEAPNGPYSGTLPQLARLNADGSADATFNTGGMGASAGFSLLLPQPDGKLLLVTDSYNGQSVPYSLLRLTADGVVDNTFNRLADFYNPQLVQPDGKILVSTNAQGSTRTFGNTQLLRLNADGSLDGAFAPVAVPQSIFTGDNLFTGYLYQPADGKIIAYGSFTTVLGQGRGGLARLVPGVVTATRAATAALPLVVYPNPAQRQLTVVLPALTQPAQATLLGLTGQVVRQWPLAAGQAEAHLDLGAVAAGLYVLRIPSAAGVHQQKVAVAP